MKQNEVFEYLSLRLREIFESTKFTTNIHEIRLRVGQPLLIEADVGEVFLSEEGLPVASKAAYIVKENDIRETLEYISNYSLYAYEEELKNGYITIPGGNRIGICGRVVSDFNGIKTIRNISSINIRMAHEIVGCSDGYMDKIFQNKIPCHTLIISPPCSGKTTFLRDVIRNISDGFGNVCGMTVGVVDERSEIAASCHGELQNNIGSRTDVLDACPKAYGMIMLIRSMAPKVIAVDEIGKKEDISALEYCMNCGCKIIATIHASSMEELKNKPIFKQVLENKLFERYVLMSGIPRKGTVTGIYNENGELL